MINKVCAAELAQWTGEGTRFPPMRPGRLMWVEFVGSLLCAESFFFPGTAVFPSTFPRCFPKYSKTNFWFEMICVQCQFQLTVFPISAPARVRLDTKFLSFSVVYFSSPNTWNRGNSGWKLKLVAHVETTTDFGPYQFISVTWKNFHWRRTDHRLQALTWNHLLSA